MRTTYQDIRNLADELSKITGQTYVIHPVSNYYNFCLKNERGGLDFIESGTTRELAICINEKINKAYLAQAMINLLAHVCDAGAAKTPDGGDGVFAYKGTVYAQVQEAIDQLRRSTGRTFTLSDEPKPRLLRHN